MQTEIQREGLRGDREMQTEKQREREGGGERMR